MPLELPMYIRNHSPDHRNHCQELLDDIYKYQELIDKIKYLQALKIVISLPSIAFRNNTPYIIIKSDQTQAV